MTAAGYVKRALNGRAYRKSMAITLPGSPMSLPRGFYWLEPPTDERGGLAGMPCPDDSELSALPSYGIGLVVSLLESSKGHYRLPPGLRLIRLPIDDNAAPAEAHFELVARLCAVVRHFRLRSDSRNGVAVHCEHGRGRTGLMLSAYRAYVAAQYPEDPEGRTPAETIAEVHRKLQEVYGTPAYSLAAKQIHWVAQYARKVQRHVEGEWKVGAATEVQWQRTGGAPEAMTGGARWQCPDCGGLAWREQPGDERP